VDSCEHGNKLLGFIKGGQFLDKLNDYYHLRSTLFHVVGSNVTPATGRLHIVSMLVILSTFRLFLLPHLQGYVLHYRKFGSTASIDTAITQKQEPNQN